MRGLSTESQDGAYLVRRVLDAGLRGRGGGWFPVARKWQAVRTEAADPFRASRLPPIVVANGAESEPGSIKDQHLMRERPADVLAGLSLAARAVGAREAVIFLKGSFSREAAALEAARSQARLDGVSVAIRHGENSYVAGEETAILEVLEGRRAWPRPKPPLPFASGFEGRPTLVQNVETLARVPAAVAEPARFKAEETTFVTVWGHVRRPGVHEVKLGTPLRRIVEEQGGGATEGLGWIFPAGPSAAPLRGADADTPLDPDALKAAGSGLGTASILVIGESACPLRIAASLAAFFEREACGQCPPCTMGTANLARILRAVEAGTARAADLQHLAEAAGFMADHGYCAHSRTAATSVTGLLRRCPEDVAAHLGGRGCPRPAGSLDPFAPGSAERAAIEFPA
jgi:NADH-quinone oxidoreductase subunit F